MRKIEMLDEHDIYNCPINLQFGAVKNMYSQELDHEIIRVVQQVGIDIDKEGLVAALNNDQKRYQEAYNQGYSDCKKEYEERLLKIAKLTGVYLESEGE